MKSEANPADTDSGRVDGFLLAAVDLSIGGCIFAVPLLLGGRHPLGQLLLVILAVVGAVAWTTRRSLAARAIWRHSRIEPLLLAAAALLVFQLTPLPECLLAWLRGDAAQTLSLWVSQDSSLQAVPGHMGRWACLSLAPWATREALVTLMSYSMLFLLIVQRVQSLADVERLLRWMAVATVAMAAFGLVQMLTSNGKFFWFLEHHGGTTEGAACGSFLNRNRFAGFLALGVGPVVWWALAPTRHRDDGRPAIIAMSRWSGLAVVLLAVLLSLSRGGTAAGVIALVVVLFVCYRSKALRGGSLGAMAGVAILVGVCLGVCGHERVAGRMDDWFSGSLQGLDRDAHRRTVWKATAAAALANMPLGSGAGTHRYVCPLYLDASLSPAYVESAGRFFSAHADNGPLEVFEETGIAGAALLAVAVAVAGFWCLGGLFRSKSRRLSLALGAVAASLAAGMAHNLVDCAWYVPGCMVAVVVLLAAGCRLYQLSGNDARRRSQRVVLPRAFAVACTLVLLSLGVWMLAGRIGPVAAEPHWNTYRLLCRTQISRDAAGVMPDEARSQTSQTDDKHEDDKCEGNVCCEAGERLECGFQRTADVTLEKMVDALENVVRWDPRRVDAHVQLAGVYLLLFEDRQAASELNRMPLSALRDAAVASGFRSRRELEGWLARSVGPHYRLLEKSRRHAHAAAALCPLEGAAYVYLAELCFLECDNNNGIDSHKSVSQAYLQQALAVRPFDGAILLAAGNEAALGGDFELALTLWKRSYRAGRVHQRELIRRLLGHVCPQDIAGEIDFFLDNFEPDLPILRRMEKAYAEIAEAGQMVRLRRTHAEALHAKASRTPRGRRSAQLWMEARLVHVKLEEQAAAVRCLEEALRCDPNSYKAHYRLALALLDREDLPEARRHLQWCLARKSDDRRARKKFKEVLRLEASLEGVASQQRLTR